VMDGGDGCRCQPGRRGAAAYGPGKMDAAGTAARPAAADA